MPAPWSPNPHLSLCNAEPPAPLSTKINRWLWLSVALSASAPSLMAYGHLHHAPPESQLTPPAEHRQRGAGTPRAFTLALAAVSLLYAAVLLVLSHRERALARPRIAARVCAEEEGLESTRHTTARLRQTLSLLMVAVGQSFLAALCLYVGVRVTFLLRAASRAPPFGRVYADFGLVAGQLGLVTYVILCCVIHEAKMETYLYLEEEREAEDMVGFIRDDRMDEE